MALKKMEFFITPTSTKSVEEARDAVVGILNNTQNASTNKLDESTFKNDYFAGMFDTRDKKSYLVFGDEAKNKYGLEDSLMDISGGGEANCKAQDTFIIS